MDLAQKGNVIRDELVAVTPDSPGYGDAVDKASQATAGLAAEGVRLLSAMRAEIYALLTTEQRALLQDKWQQQRDQWTEWRSRHQAPGQ